MNTDLNTPHVLASSLCNIVNQLQLSDTEISMILNISLNEWLEIQQSSVLNPEGSAGQHALKLIRLYHSLVQLNGGDLVNMRVFLNAKNHVLSAVPRELMCQAMGLNQVVEWVENLSTK